MHLHLRRLIRGLEELVAAVLSFCVFLCVMSATTAGPVVVVVVVGGGGGWWWWLLVDVDGCDGDGDGGCCWWW